MMQHDSDAEVETVAWEKPQAARSLLQVVWHRKAFVLLGAFVGLALGFLFHSQRAPVYQSSCSVLVIKKRSSEAFAVNAGMGNSMYIEDYAAQHAYLLKTPLILERAVIKGQLGQLKTFENTGEPAGAVIGGLSVSRDTKESSGNIIQLTYRGPVAEDCGEVLKAILVSYQEFLDVTYHNVSDETHRLITGARDQLTQDVEAAEKEFDRFRNESPTPFPNEKGVNIEQANVATIKAERNALELKQIQLRQKIDLLKKAIADGKGLDVLPAVWAGGATPEAKKLAAEKYEQEPMLPLILEEQKLLEDYGDDHPKVIDIRHRMKTMRDHLAKLSPQTAERDPAKRVLTLLEHEWSEIDITLKASEVLLEKSMNIAKSLFKYENEENRLKTKLVRLRGIHERTVKLLDEINLVRNSGGFSAKQLSTPGAGVKVAPIAYQDLGISLILGLLLGVGLAYLAELSDKSFRSPDEVRRRLGLPIVGHIPFITADPEAERKRLAGETTVDPLLVSHFRPKSLDAEAYRAVRTALFFATQGVGHKVIQVTSPNKGDGKSLMIGNLAVMVAQSGKRVLLIDADLRRPRQQKVFGVDMNIGLSNVLAGTAEPPEAIQPTNFAGLSIMACGPIPPNPAELLTSPRFKELLEAMRSEFDYVLVDTPPLLAVTDPCIVASRVDGLFLTIRLTRKGRPDAERAREILAGLQVRIFGVVVNGIARGTTGIYSPNVYDYTETYEQEESDGDGDYYYYEQDEADKPKVAAPVSANGHAHAGVNGSSTEPESGGGKGFWGRLWS